MDVSCERPRYSRFLFPNYVFFSYSLLAIMNIILAVQIWLSCNWQRFRIAMITPTNYFGKSSAEEEHSKNATDLYYIDEFAIAQKISDNSTDCIHVLRIQTIHCEQF